MIELLIALAIFGFLLWVAEKIPMNPVAKQIFMGAAVLIMVIYVLQAVGVVTGFRPVVIR